MAGTFKFELVSPERILLSGDAELAMLPGTEGDMTVLPGHAPLVTSLRPGVLDVVIGGTRTRIFVKRGFAEIEPAGVTVLAERALGLADLDEDKISAEIEIAQREHAEAEEDHARFMASEALSSLTKLKAAHW
jgi:F-type H+-transporting ATPase subunit epsilon